MLLPLESFGAAKGEGTGTFHAKLLVTSDVGARAGGGNAIVLAPMAGAAAAQGLGQISWEMPGNPVGLEDIWFYGATKVKAMLGQGAARGEGGA